MTITYKEIRKLIRFKEKDNNEIRFSDYDIKMAVNEVLRYFSNSYALQNSDFLEKVLELDEKKMNKEIAKQNEELGEDEQLDLYDFRNTGVELPDDFISLQGIIRCCDNTNLHPADGIRTPRHDQYKIMGGRLYLGAPCVKVLYKAALTGISDEDDEIELPFIFKDYIVKLACMILENSPNTDVLTEAVNDAVAKLVPRRRYVNTRIRMPFRV